MLEFFRTQAGRVFFDGSIPRLIKALERIASALETQEPPKPTLPEEVYVTLETLKVIKAEMLDVHYPKSGLTPPVRHRTMSREAIEKFMQLCEEMAHVPF